MNNTIISKVHLLNVPLENDYKHTLYFSDESSQINYFLSKKQYTFENVSYQRKDFKIRVNKHIDKINNCNYVMYQNSFYTNKWFFAFITSKQYINDSVTEIEIETDVMQTWAFDITIKPSFVEREHVTDDSIGANTIPEGLETGGYICNAQYTDMDNKDLTIVLAAGDYSEKVQGNIKGDLYGGIYSGMNYTCYNKSTDGISSLNNLIKSYDENAKADGINSIFMCPRWLTGISDGAIAATIGRSETAKTRQKEYSKSSTLDSYTPRNKKLLCHPYQYLYVDNNAGSSAIYEYEKFSDSSCKFEMCGVVTPGCSIRLNPLNYKGVEKNISEGINGGKFPICCWNSDAYTNWLTSNGINIGISAVSGIATSVLGGVAMATGVGTVAGASMIASGVGMVANTVAQVEQQSKVPDQARGNTNCGDVMTATESNCFMFYKMSIKKEMARVIDEYFDMFGYKVNRVKVPNKAHRNNYWFTKTIDINIDGTIPSEDMRKIKDNYNRGITFWRSNSDIQNYSVSNNIV